MIIFHLRMKLAALRQFLRDRQMNLTEREIDAILDQIRKITDILEELEKRK